MATTPCEKTPDANRMRILISYFSATGNTAGIAHLIKKKFTLLGASVDEIDITPYSARTAGMDLEPYDAVVFGFPVHSWRAPRVVRDWLRTLEGRKKKCSTFFTYGGFGIHPAHESTRRILAGQGFSVVSSAEFLAPHTFNLGGWKAMVDRPNPADLALAGEYATKTFQRFTGKEAGMLGECEPTRYSDEELDAIESFRFRVLTHLPSRDGNDCRMCRVCEAVCPAGAMDARSGNADPGRCIACLNCVAVCEDNALIINDMTASWEQKLAMEHITEQGMHAKQSRIYL